MPPNRPTIAIPEPQSLRKRVEGNEEDAIRNLWPHLRSGVDNQRVEELARVDNEEYGRAYFPSHRVPARPGVEQEEAGGQDYFTVAPTIYDANGLNYTEARTMSDGSSVGVENSLIDTVINCDRITMMLGVPGGASWLVFLKLVGSLAFWSDPQGSGLTFSNADFVLNTSTGSSFLDINVPRRRWTLQWWPVWIGASPPLGCQVHFAFMRNLGGSSS